jgi:flagellar basal body-associated protein FliL
VAIYSFTTYFLLVPNHQQPKGCTQNNRGIFSMAEHGDRIVVKLEQPTPQFTPSPQMGSVPPPVSSPPKKRGGCFLKGCVVLLILSVIVVAVAGIGGYFYWGSFKSKPAYSLALLIDAAGRNDQKEIDELFDTDKVVEDYVAEVKEQANKSPILIGPLKQIVEQVIQRMMPEIKEKAREEVKTRIKEIGVLAEGKPFIIYALALPWVIDIKEEGDKASATINTPTNQIELKMERNGDKWKIVGAKDDQAVNRIVERVLKEVTSGGKEK